MYYIIVCSHVCFCANDTAPILWKQGIVANTMSSRHDMLWHGLSYKHQSFTTQIEVGWLGNCVTRPPPSPQSTRSTLLEGVIREHFTMLYAMLLYCTVIIYNYIYNICITHPHPFSCGQVTFETFEIFDLKVLLQRASVLLRLPQSTCAWEPMGAMGNMRVIRDSRNDENGPQM